jgi:hypothetical protein
MGMVGSGFRFSARPFQVRRSIEEEELRISDCKSLNSHFPELLRIIDEKQNFALF